MATMDSELMAKLTNGVFVEDACSADTTSMYPLTDVYWAGKSPICDIVIAQSPVFGKVLFLDKEIQSAESDEAIYHEHLIHPIMNTMRKRENKRVLVVGGGDSALDLALTIVNETKDLYVLHRSDRFNSHEETTKKLYSSNAEIRTFSEITEIEGDTNHVTSVSIKNTKTGEVEKLEIDEIIIAIGLLFNLEVVQQWGINMEGNSIVVDHNRQTSIPGIYAAGDIVTYPGKMKLIGPGTSEVMQAIHHAKHYIQENFPYL